MESPVRDGDLLAGKYRIGRVIGIGGMGIVVSAVHLQLEQRVALKFLHADAVARPEHVARLIREAKAAANIKSQHVARVMDVGALDDGSPYLVMEYLDGQDLAAFFLTHGPLPLESAVELILQICEALAEAHVRGIVHRDLKPANLFLVQGPDGLPCIKVLDFGISKMRGAGPTNTDLSITGSSAVLGSPLYMSPEQVSSSRDVDARTDIWSLGVVLYEMLAGHVPFQGDMVPDVYTRIRLEPPARLSSLRPGLPHGIDAIIGRCLAKDRDRRYENVAKLAQALAPYAPKRAQARVEQIHRVLESGIGARAAGVEPAVSVSEHGARSTTAVAGMTGRDARKRRSFRRIGGLTVLVGAALAARATTTRERETEMAPLSVAMPSLGSTAIATNGRPSADDPATMLCAPQGSVEVLALPAAPTPTSGPAPSSTVGASVVRRPKMPRRPSVSAPRPTGADLFRDSK